MSTVEIMTSDRLARGDEIIMEATSASLEFAEVFLDLSGVRAPIYLPGPPTTTPEATAPAGLPQYPDDARQTSAITAISEIDGEIDNLDQNVLPEIDDALTGMRDEITSITAKLTALNAMADNIVIPSASDFLYSEGDYRADNDLDAVLKNIIATEIKKGGEGYAADAEAAAYERGQERREIDRQAAIDAALDEQSGRGFSMPQGFHYGAVEAVNEKYRLDDRGLSKDIMLAQSKLSIENKWKAIDAGIGYNQIIIAFYDTMAQRALEAAIAVSSVTLDAIKYRLAAALKQLELAKAGVGAIADGRRMDIERYGTAILMIGKKIDGLLAKSRGYIMAYRTDGQIFTAGIEVAARQSKNLQGDNLLALETQRGAIMSGMSAARNALTSYLETAGIRLGSAQAMAQMQKANAAGALESLDTVVQLFKSGEISISDG